MTCGTCLILAVTWQVQQFSKSPCRTRCQEMKTVWCPLGYMFSTPHTWLCALDKLYSVTCCWHLILGCMLFHTSYLPKCLRHFIITCMPLTPHTCLHALRHLILVCMPSTPHPCLDAFDTSYLFSCLQHIILVYMPSTSYTWLHVLRHLILVFMSLTLHPCLHAFDTSSLLACSQYLIRSCMLSTPHTWLHAFNTLYLVRDKKEGDAFTCLVKRWLKRNFKSIIIKTKVVLTTVFFMNDAFEVFLLITFLFIPKHATKYEVSKACSQVWGVQVCN